ncbi:MAG: alkaline phosphatase [Rhodothermales bacterium]|nr:alkaline phosphatase [Rhodothermales bacterium]
MPNPSSLPARRRSIAGLFAVSCVILLASGCARLAPPSPAKPTNVILMIGDGMGLAQISTLYFNDTVATSYFEQFGAFGYIKTKPTDAEITDSAAGATSFASGVKTYNAAIGMDADTARVETIVERLSRTGQLTGLVATSSIVHATPASFFAHVAHRNMYEDIATQLPGSGVDFFAGGGVKFFADRKDGQDVYNQLIDAGFAMDSTALAGTPAPPQKYGFLLAPDGMPRVLEGRGPFLTDATRMALAYLDQGDRGFFLMVEGSQIDWGGHENNTEYLMTEMADFNDAIGAAIEFAARDGNTLVVVTADHETGGLALSTGAGYGEMIPTFSTGGHTGSLIPVFAFGPGAEAFTGIYENTEIFHKIVSAAAW